VCLQHNCESTRNIRKKKKCEGNFTNLNFVINIFATGAVEEILGFMDGLQLGGAEIYGYLSAVIVKTGS
jgi:hypothetical protein